MRISAVDCTQIKDLNNLCVRPTIAFKQAKLGIDSLQLAMLRFFTVEMMCWEDFLCQVL